MQKAVVGLSGGVDSAVCAALLKQRGLEVCGLFIHTGVEDPSSAEKVARRLSIDFEVYDAAQRMKDEVCRPFVEEYLSGKTPNPCVICNPRVKFKALCEQAERLGAEYIATGHYARCGTDPETGEPVLLKARAKEKDQSYVLYRLSPETLKRTLFPLGGVASKEETRACAAELCLPPSARKDSMEICFIPSGDHAAYVEAKAATPKEGRFVGENGETLGGHKGVHRYTIGQRRGLSVAAGSRMYVTDIDAADNTVTLSPRDPYRKEISVCGVNWLVKACELAPFRADVKVRHSKNEWPATVYPLPQARARILFDTAARAPAPGQSAVFYIFDKVAGGGFIEKP